MSATIALIALVCRHSEGIALATGVDENVLLDQAMAAKAEHDRLRARAEAAEAQLAAVQDLLEACRAFRNTKSPGTRARVLHQAIACVMREECANTPLKPVPGLGDGFYEISRPQPPPGAETEQPTASELRAYEERIAAAYRDRDYCAREADKAQRRAEAAEAQLAAVREALESFAQDVAAARRNREPPRGMQVPYHGPFCSAVPSVIRDLERQVMRFERALDAEDEC